MSFEELQLELDSVHLREGSGLNVTDISKILNEGVIQILGEDHSVVLIGDGEIKYQTTCVTAKVGFGHENNSGKTPTGLFRISEIIGNGDPSNTLFVGRKKKGVVEFTSNGNVISRGIVSRILVLDGMEEKNKNTESRHIYIHGNAHLWYWDTDDLNRTLGCIGIKYNEIIELANLVLERKIQGKETYVYIKKSN